MIFQRLSILTEKRCDFEEEKLMNALDIRNFDSDRDSSEFAHLMIEKVFLDPSSSEARLDFADAKEIFDRNPNDLSAARASILIATYYLKINDFEEAGRAYSWY